MVSSLCMVSILQWDNPSLAAMVRWAAHRKRFFAGGPCSKNFRFFPSMKRVAVVGSDGMLGRVVCRDLEGRGFQVFPFDRRSALGEIPIGFLDPSLIDLFVAQKIEVILHLAALKDIAFCEQHPEASLEVNGMLTLRLVQIAERCAAQIVYLSTDYVLAESEGVLDEEADPRPRTVYAAHKLLSEQLIQSRLKHWAIVRTSQIFGLAGDFVHLVQDVLRKGEVMQAWCDLHNNPTHVEDLMTALVYILEEGGQGIFHFSGRDALSRYGFALLVAEVFSLDAARIVAATLPEGDVRPRFVQLDSAASWRKAGMAPTSVRDALVAIKKQSQ